MEQRRQRGRMRGPKSIHSRRLKSYKVICAGCGKEIVVQVPPPDDKKLLCVECFRI
jgi:CxxC-x17-CxxC domain-containing protein